MNIWNRHILIAANRDSERSNNHCQFSEMKIGMINVI